MQIEPTEEERRAIATLKRLAKRWPDSLWLFSASGSLCVMRNRQDGQRALSGDSGQDGADSDYCLATIDIPNDGGDW
ncbi:hypothetical protein [Agrobacterium pusense]|uniref:hypothetical protein n=1 Tax=Agrobacterium pusense TaxID=648995 RepID=UPI000D1BC012|nr:hypothetical protein [Agrobacterium pusense]